MGCGVSSTNAKDSLLSSNSRAVISRAHMQHESNKPLFNMRLKDKLEYYNEIEDETRAMEETKCYVRFIMANDELNKLNAELNSSVEAMRQIERSIYNLPENNDGENTLPNPSPRLLRELVISKWARPTELIRDIDMRTMQMLNSQEMIATRIEWIQEDIDKQKLAHNNMHELNNHLQYLYDERDIILSAIFDGEYGSGKERDLEIEMRSLTNEKNIAEMTKLQWLDANERIIEALKFLENGCSKIEQSIDALNNGDLEHKYICLREARNSYENFIYKLETLHKSLNIELQHLTLKDLETMQKLAEQIFENSLAREDDRLQHTIEIAQNLNRKTVLQQKWIKKTLNTIIKESVQDIRQRYHSNLNLLRAERTLLIKQKLSKESQENLKQDLPLDLRVDSGVESEQGISSETHNVIHDEKFARLLASGKQSELSNGTPLLPGEELGPIPTDKEIFSKIERLQNKHTREMAEFEQNQRLMRVRMAQGLQDKLINRRDRRSRQQMHRRELEALQESPITSQ